jgi:hypothetical protein
MTINVKDWGANGDGATDDSAAIQAALDAADASQDLDVIFPSGNYACHGLETATDSLRIRAMGAVILQKNDDGPIISCTGYGQEINGIAFYGDAAEPAFTGHNIHATGSQLRLINCGSRWAAGRAVLSEGNTTHIIGTCDIYQTADESATGFDIELGNAEGNTLYSMLIAVYTSQPTGGVKLVRAGGTLIQACQFGKLSTDTGSGGFFVGNRIVGAATIRASNTTLDNNAFADDVTIGDGSTTTSGIMFGPGNIVSAGRTFTLSANVIDGSFHLGQLYSNGVTVVNNSRVDNDIWHGPIAWQPAIGADGGSPTFGNGTVVANYCRSGRVFTANFQLTVGSTTNFGTGSHAITLPYPSGTGGALGAAFFIDGGTRIGGAAHAEFGTPYVFTAPATALSLAAGDYYLFEVSGAV